MLVDMYQYVLYAFFYNDKLLFSFYIDNQSIKFCKSELRSWNELCTFTKDYLEHKAMIK